MSPAYARRLLARGAAVWEPHHALPCIRLTAVIAQPALRPIVVGVRVHLRTAELIIVADGRTAPLPMLHVFIDLTTDLPARLRRHAGHRRRRRSRGRYRPLPRYGRPFKLRRPSLALTQWGQSHWRTAHRRVRRPQTPSPVLRWRASAIERTIDALVKLMPISQIVLLDPSIQAPFDAQDIGRARLRRRLIAVYGLPDPATGTKRPQCAYCGTTAGVFTIDHIVPRSSGGTDAWNNCVLACRRCNAQKGDQTLAAAGMRLRIRVRAAPQANRAGAYQRGTMRLLARATGRKVWWVGRDDDAIGALAPALQALLHQPAGASVLVAKPIGRASKQRFSARNYPRSTALTAGYVRYRTTIKRRITINRAVVIEPITGKVTVIPAETGGALPANALRRGMLVDVQRDGGVVRGIISALHSTGRVTVLCCAGASPAGITWTRIAVHPRHIQRAIASGVVFLHFPTSR